MTNAKDLIKHAVDNGLVILIHPLDMAELLIDPSFGNTIDILKTTDVITEPLSPTYLVIKDKVYFQTTEVAQVGSTIV